MWGVDMGQIRRAILAALFHKLGKDHDALSLDAAFDMGGVVGDQRDLVHRRAALGRKARAFDVQVLDQHNGIARCEGDAVAVFVRGVLGDVVGPRLRFVVEVELIREVTRPVGVDAPQRAGGEDLEGGIVGPHGRGDCAEVVGGCAWVCAGGADIDGCVGGASGDGSWLERGVCGCAEGAGHRL